MVTLIRVCHLQVTATTSDRNLANNKFLKNLLTVADRGVQHENRKNLHGSAYRL
jgi:hypothetical protein